ncbi:putative HD superfamily hydrolase of NAD metabolism [Anaerosphaera aminiphila DSM 21120]|uniref:bis(5'-nucleosyl)-tetraphosphatase (symmetrical) n=1 Tax=Anaerosphaera aminiphila DSM 21120 TaxID=1120995 RepID=A0A1M5P5B6_9FIRM|nr:bis(5'-nucleosyl)-tetraphosphatase (symmetrical) YqeK [Anaerosphaera aminiphila]SHG96948.1 putative HD superfamily hydrolase of NAD metabolism [Anaerosphaera aminiphila DSM 21120]
MTNPHEEDIINRIGEKRFEHSLRVMQTAEKLAEKYDVDIKKARTAAYYHDCAKIGNSTELFKQCEIYNLKIDHEMKMAPQIIHGYLGAVIAKKNYGIDDEDILNAIKYHTTGREDMSKLEKIIFLADYIEPKRNFKGVDTARTLASEDLDKAMYFSLNNTVEFLCSSNEYIVLDSIKARNYILEMSNGKIF